MGYPDVSFQEENRIEVWRSGKSSEQKTQISEKGNPWHKCDFPGRKSRKYLRTKSLGIATLKG